MGYPQVGKHLLFMDAVAVKITKVALLFSPRWDQHHPKMEVTEFGETVILKIVLDAEPLGDNCIIAHQNREK